MKTRKPLRIQTTLWLAMALMLSSTVLAAGALYGFQLYRASRQQERVRVRTIAETYAAQISGMTLANDRPNLQQFMDDLAWHGSLVLIAVTNENGDVIASRGSQPLLDQYTALPGANLPSQEPQWINFPAKPDGMIPELNLVAVPITPPGGAGAFGQLICAARPLGAFTASLGEMWAFFCTLMLIGVTGLVLAVSWARHAIVKPLARIGKRKLSGRPGDLPLDRADEIGEVARAFASLHEDLHDAKDRGERLERTMTDRVSDQTSQIKRELERERKRAWTDPLTRLGNRQLFNDKFGEIFRAQADAGMDLSVVMLDVDNFKTLNDTLGHQAGDELLKFIGELLKQTLRDNDLAVRLGGDEFILILPSAHAEAAVSVADRTIRMFSQQAKLLDVTPKPTLSAGVASLAKHRAATPDGLIQLADEALYDAKGAGKSQVVMFESRKQPVVVR